LTNASNSSSLFGASPFRNLNSLKNRIATLITVFDVMRSSVLIFDRCDSRAPIVWMDNSREGTDCALLAHHPPRQARFWDYVRVGDLSLVIEDCPWWSLPVYPTTRPMRTGFLCPLSAITIRVKQNRVLSFMALSEVSLNPWVNLMSIGIYNPCL